MKLVSFNLITENIRQGWFDFKKLVEREIKTYRKLYKTIIYLIKTYRKRYKTIIYLIKSKQFTM